MNPDEYCADEYIRCHHTYLPPASQGECAQKPGNYTVQFISRGNHQVRSDCSQESAQGYTGKDEGCHRQGFTDSGYGIDYSYGCNGTDECQYWNAGGLPGLGEHEN